MSGPDPAGPDHPLADLTGDEITAVTDALRRAGRVADGTRFAYMGLLEPPKEVVRRFAPGGPVGERRVRVVLVDDGHGADLVEAVVVLPAGEVERFERVADARPALLMEEAIRAIEVVKADPDYRAAMARRGIDDLEQLQIDPWPAGHFGVVHEEGRRITRCLTYLRGHPEDNGYARPVEGVIVFVDLGRGTVLEVQDHGVVPVPADPGSYLPEDHQPLRHPAPLHITQPSGPGFSVEGNLVRWDRFSLRVSMDPLEGLVLHTIGYDDGGRVRPIVYRASISEMVVPYGDPGPLHGWKNAFDVGEWGLGRMANSLAEGCDCLGEIRYLDHVFADEQGRPRTKPNAICLHEEDYGILWKHADLFTGRVEVRRSRRMVISSIATVGNYEYGFYWYLYLDGTIQLEVKLTGIMSTMALAEGEEPRFATVLGPGLAAPVHQHLFSARLDMEVDGPANSVYEVDTVPLAADDPDNPWGNAFEPVPRLLERESEAQRMVDAARSRHWRVVNRSRRNATGQPVAYKLLPAATPTLLASPDSSVGRRARFATRNLWVTPFAPDQLRAAGDHPNQHRGGDGLARWTGADRSLVDTDVVLWHTFGVTHVPRLEDWPVMPVEYTGFSLVASGFFDRNPALDLAPPDAACHGGEGAGPG